MFEFFSSYICIVNPVYILYSTENISSALIIHKIVRHSRNIYGNENAYQKTVRQLDIIGIESDYRGSRPLLLIMLYF